MNNDRGDKFRPRDQKPLQPFNHQKSDPAAAKKKKRKTGNSLGLTPGDDNSDDDIDEEKRLEELLGTDAPGYVTIFSLYNQCILLTYSCVAYPRVIWRSG